MEVTNVLQGWQNFLGLPRPVQSNFILWRVPHFGQMHSTVTLSFFLGNGIHFFSFLRYPWVLVVCILISLLEGPIHPYLRWTIDGICHAVAAAFYFFFFMYFWIRSSIASSKSFPRDLSVSTARCLSALSRSSSILVENVFFWPMTLILFYIFTYFKYYFKIFLYLNIILFLFFSLFM